MTKPKPIQIPTQPSDRPGHYKGAGTHRDGVVVTVEGEGGRLGLGGWTVEGEGRLEQGGPMVRGPVAYLFPLATVLADNPEMSSGADMRRSRAAGRHFALRAGDLVEIAGTVFRVTIPPRRGWVQYPRLEVVS